MPKYRVKGPFPAVPAAAELLRDRHARRAFGMVLADRLYHLRLARVRDHGDLYSQERVARVLGRSQTWLSNIENGHQRIDAPTLRLLADFYEITPDALLAPPAPGPETALFERERIPPPPPERP